MATFQARIEDYVGPFSDTQALSDWLTAGARLHLRLLPKSKLQEYTEDLTDPDGNGVLIGDNLVLSVSKSGYESIGFPASMRARITDSDSLYLATAKSPAHYIHEGKLFVKPGGGSAEVVPMPTVLHSNESLPVDIEDATVLYAALQALQSNINDAISNIAADPTFPAAPSLTAYPSPPDLTVVSSSVTATTIEALPSPPNYSSQIPPSAPSYSSPSKPSLSGNYSGMDSAITDDDFVKAKSIVDEITTQLNEYSKDIEEAISKYANDIREYSEIYSLNIQNEVADFNSENADFQREVDRLIEQARISLQEELKTAEISQRNVIEQERLDLQLYANQVQQVASENSGILDKYAREVQAVAEETRVELEAAAGKVQTLIESSKSLRMEYQIILAGYYDAAKAN